MATILVTGAAGFLGRHVCLELAKQNTIIGVDKSQQDVPGCTQFEVVDANFGLHRIVLETKPNFVVHCAFENKKQPDQDDAAYLTSFVEPNINLFKTCAELEIAVVLISSSAVYGSPAGTALIDESFPILPISIYGIAKANQELLAQYATASAGLRLCTLRLFNLCGPGQRLGMLLPDWISQVARISKGEINPVLKIRNQASSRDFVDVRDAAIAVSDVIRNFKVGETFNVASGQAISLTSINAELKKLCAISYEIIETHPTLQTTDAISQRGSNQKLKNCFGWNLNYTWQQSIREMWKEWCENV